MKFKITIKYILERDYSVGETNPSLDGHQVSCWAGIRFKQNKSVKEEKLVNFT